MRSEIGGSFDCCCLRRVFSGRDRSGRWLIERCNVVFIYLEGGRSSRWGSVRMFWILVMGFPSYWRCSIQSGFRWLCKINRFRWVLSCWRSTRINKYPRVSKLRVPHWDWRVHWSSLGIYCSLRGHLGLLWVPALRGKWELLSFDWYYINIRAIFVVILKFPNNTDKDG